jgi:hypothetical protein
MTNEERAGLQAAIYQIEDTAQKRSLPYAELPYKRKEGLSDEESESYKVEYRTLALNAAFDVSKWKGDTAIMVFHQDAKNWAIGQGYEFDEE